MIVVNVVAIFVIVVVIIVVVIVVLLSSMCCLIFFAQTGDMLSAPMLMGSILYILLLKRVFQWNCFCNGTD
jgi:hypothetical protein